MIDWSAFIRENWHRRDEKLVRDCIKECVAHIRSFRKYPEKWDRNRIGDRA